jgi:hypothetical protein
MKVIIYNLKANDVEHLLFNVTKFKLIVTKFRQALSYRVNLKCSSIYPCILYWYKYKKMNV